MLVAVLGFSVAVKADKYAVYSDMMTWLYGGSLAFGKSKPVLRTNLQL